MGERFLKAKWAEEDRNIKDLPPIKATCLSWSKFNSCGAEKVIVPRADSVSDPSYGRCCRTPNGCPGTIISFHRYGSTKENCGGNFMKAHTNSRRRFPLECGQCTCAPDR